MSAPAPPLADFDGVIEVAGRLPGLPLRVLAGWLRDPGIEAAAPPGGFALRWQPPAEAQEEGWEGVGLPAFHDRADLAGKGVGVVLLAPEPAPLAAQEAATGLNLQREGAPALRLRPAGAFFRSLPPKQLLAMARRILNEARGPDLARMRRLLADGLFGANPLEALPAPVLAGIEAVMEAEEGVLLHGWLADPRGAVARLRLAEAGGAAFPLQELRLPATRTEPPAALAGRPEFGDRAAGFIAFAPLPQAQRGRAWLEVELVSGALGCLPLPPPRRPGLPAIMRVLREARFPAADAARVFDRILGAPLVAQHRAALARPVGFEELRFGAPPEAPRASIIVPLHGRLDFMAVQLALFSAGGVAGDELIYVLDDPPQRAAFRGLAESCHARFGHPFRALLAEESRGFGPASNLGLSEARGEYACFLNSDAFPRDVAWLDRLVAALEADAGAGVTGGLLLFPDGTVQHAGMDYERIPALGGFPFPRHPGKGLLPEAGLADAAPRPVPALTGACLVLRRALAEELGGFQGDYVLGDFEDADLCERIRARGLRCLLVPAAVLVHLERQSQGGAEDAGRRNTTVLNAWSFARRHPAVGTP